MNTYLVPTTAAYCYEPYDNLYMVCANSPKEAYTMAYYELKGKHIPLKQAEYEYFPFKLHRTESTFVPFHNSIKNAILISSLLKTKGAEHMKHFQVNWKDYTEELANKANDESW